MAFFKINRHILQDPASLGAINKSFATVEEFEPYSGDGPFKWYRVTGPGIPGHDVEIELLFTIISPTDVSIQWRPLNNL